MGAGSFVSHARLAMVPAAACELGQRWSRSWGEVVATGDGTPGHAARGIVWLVGLLASLVLVGIPARKIGYLSSQRLLDVVTEHGATRFAPLAVFVAVWALVASVFVHVVIDVIPQRSRRRLRDRSNP